MRRRAFVATCGTVLAGGCLGNAARSGSEPREVDFQRQASPFVIEVRNARDQPIEATLQTASAGTDTASKTLSLDAGGVATVTDPFESEAGSYAVTVSAADLRTERTIEPRETDETKFVFEIQRAAITFERTHRRTADLAVSNTLDRAVELTVTVDARSTDAPTVADTLDLSAGAFAAYRGVFDLGTEYAVTVTADGKEATATIRNSFTNTLSVVVDEALQVDVSDS